MSDQKPIYEPDGSLDEDIFDLRETLKADPDYEEMSSKQRMAYNMGTWEMLEMLHIAGWALVPRKD